mgnify:CR=1 FL=1
MVRPFGISFFEGGAGRKGKRGGLIPFTGGGGNGAEGRGIMAWNGRAGHDGAAAGMALRDGGMDDGVPGRWLEAGRGRGSGAWDSSGEPGSRGRCLR